MSLLRLTFCVVGIYTCFLTWGVTQERLSTTVYKETYSVQGERFTATIFLNTVQSLVSALASLVFIVLTFHKSVREWKPMLGLTSSVPEKTQSGHADPKGLVRANGDCKTRQSGSSRMILRIAQVALLQSISSPFGYASLKHISYPTMILGKSCKLVPVMLMNGLLYRRHFKAYKYGVVLMVTAGVTIFMLYGKAGSGKKGAAEDSIVGLALLMINLMLDGVTNSTQDEIFEKHHISGVQMMFWMNILSSIMTSAYLLDPFPTFTRSSLDQIGGLFGYSHHLEGPRNELAEALSFLRRHPQAFNDIALFAVCGAIGQLFIFTTLQHFGSLTLVMVTVTRKLFTMLLSVSWFGHKLSQGQWMGVTIVFAGLSLEALFGIRSGTKAKSLRNGKQITIEKQSNGDSKGAESAVLVPSEKLPDDSIFIQGPDFSKRLSLKQLLESYQRIGFQASGLARAIDITNNMRKWRLSDDAPSEAEPDEYLLPEKRSTTRATIFLGYTSNLISSGLREIFCFLAANEHVSVIVTTAGGVEEDLIKCLGPTVLGDFNMDGAGLRKRGMNRIGNLIVPNDNYCKFEDWLTPLLDEMVDEQKSLGTIWTPSRIIRRLGERIGDERSVLYQAYRKNIPIFCPALTDGSLGDMIYFHSYRKPGLVIDIAKDIRAINDIAVTARKTGMIILGGGVVKHHIANANLMRNGADWTVYINTAAEFDGSDAGARPDEAISWGKIKPHSESVKVHADATLVFPLLVAQTFAHEN